jgi:hypothetical protein
MINDNFGRFPPEARPQLERLARLAGYRFVLREVSHGKSVRAGAPLDVAMKWANVGVGKLHHPYVLRLSLSNAAGQTVARAEAKADPREWLPGEWEVAVALPVPTGLPPGEYDLAVALLHPADQRGPLQLAMDAPSKAGWYQVSRVTVR